jgi:hypothetical protein
MFNALGPLRRLFNSLLNLIEKLTSPTPTQKTIQTLRPRRTSTATKNSKKQPIYALNIPKNIRGRGGGKTGKAPHTNEKKPEEILTLD